MIHQNYQRILKRFAAKCEAENDIVSSTVFGSQADSSMSSDEWSDLDLLIFSNDHLKYYHDQSWISEIEDVQIAFFEKDVFGCGFGIRVLYDGGQDVDYLFFPAGEIT